ncbi:MAG TPA: hypothetical protein DCZ95_13720 [Verrucomicrobia bacterium]|nr:MAG: hypothetical protein A2X46_02150 [Lentisphaerae bacterium GWF2_57_35]HBA85143.1 hypothetical protein [Verrucomicrobiota bacterium]
MDAGKDPSRDTQDSRESSALLFRVFSRIPRALPICLLTISNDLGRLHSLEAFMTEGDFSRDDGLEAFVVYMRRLGADVIETGARSLRLQRTGSQEK